MPERFFVVDAHSQLFRAFHAIPGLSNSKGMPTNAVYGFTNMLRKLIREEEPDYLVAVFDAPGPTFRHEAYEDYKKSREEMPEELGVQIPWVKRVLEAFGVPILEIGGYEADDVIGALVVKASEQGLHSVIISEDKDLLQLVRDDVRMLAERGSRRVFDPDKVVEKYGVPPELVPDLLGMIGDKIDDIPGVPGVGKVGARKLLQEYGSLEEVLAHTEEISHKTYRENLTEFADQARLSKELATVQTDIEVDLDLEALALEEPDRGACRELFAELEFRGWLEEFTDEPVDAEGDYELVADGGGLEEVLERARASGALAVEVLTDSPEPMRARLVGLGLAWKPGRGAYVPLSHEGLGAENAMSPTAALEALAAFLDTASGRPAGGDGRDGDAGGGGGADQGGAAVDAAVHDLKRLLILLERHGVRAGNPHLAADSGGEEAGAGLLFDLEPPADDGARAPLPFDTMVASYVLHPTRQSHELDALSLDLLQARLPGLDELLPEKGAPVATIPPEAACRWAAGRADVALQVAAVFQPELESQGLAPLYRELEEPLIAVLADMERRGVRIDVEYLADISAELAEDLEELQSRIWEEAGREFNINSPQQLATVLFDEMGLESSTKTATGRRSTKAEVLEELAEEHDVCRWIIEYRELAKLKGTYVDALPGLVNPDTGRIHAHFNQAVAATGRLSSSNPNLQNIPVRTPLGRRIRRAFVPADGHLLMTADYSQVELRIMAHLSGDPTLREAFARGRDVHRETAARIFDVDPDEVTATQRDRAKVVNFGIMYGMGPQRLSREFGITVPEAREFIDRYFENFADVQRFLDETVEQARHDGFVTTMLGRIRHLPELQSSKGGLRAFGERVAVNTPIQGTAADLIKVAMVRLHRRLRDEGLGTAMLVQVHDELVFEVPEAEVDAAGELAREVMEGAIELDVPLQVDVGIGPNWMDAKG